MRRLALLILVAACSDDPEPPKPLPPEPPPIEVAVKWVKTQAPGSDLEIRVPEEWTSNYKVLKDEIHFGGPGEPGRRPELIFGWTQGEETPGWEFARFSNSPTYRVIGTGPTTVAGMPAAYCVLETGQTRQILFSFAGHGGHGFVRGVAPAAEFARYGRIFEEAAARLRYNPQ